MRLILILHNIRSTYNVGAILRTAEGFGLERVILSGWTPVTKWTEFRHRRDRADCRESRDEEDSQEIRRQTTEMRFLPHVLEKTTKQIAKTALGAEEMVPTEYSDYIMGRIKDLSEKGWLIVGLENNIEDKRLRVLGRDFPATGTDGVDNDRIVLVLGEEVNGIPEELYHQMNIFLEIPMCGEKESFNVSVAAGIAMWELLGRNYISPEKGVVC